MSTPLAVEERARRRSVIAQDRGRRAPGGPAGGVDPGQERRPDRKGIRATITGSTWRSMLRREHDQGETDDRALYHGLSLNLATKRLSCTSSIAVRSSIVSTGSAACGSGATRAASSRMRASRGSRCTAQLAWASCRAARGFFVGRRDEKTADNQCAPFRHREPAFIQAPRATA